MFTRHYENKITKNNSIILGHVSEKVFKRAEERESDRKEMKDNYHRIKREHNYIAKIRN